MGGTKRIAYLYLAITDSKNFIFTVDISNLVNKTVILGTLKNFHNLFTCDIVALILLGLDSDTFYIYHVAAVMVDNLRRLLLGINLSDKAIMDFDFPGVGFPV